MKEADKNKYRTTIRWALGIGLMLIAGVLAWHEFSVRPAFHKQTAAISEKWHFTASGPTEFFASRRQIDQLQCEASPSGCADHSQLKVLSTKLKWIRRALSAVSPTIPSIPGSVYSGGASTRSTDSSSFFDPRTTSGIRTRVAFSRSPTNTSLEFPASLSFGIRFEYSLTVQK